MGSALHQLVRLVREPQRIRRLHPSKVRAWLHRFVEKDEASLLDALFGLSREQYRQLERDLVGDEPFRVSIERRFREVRGQEIRLFGNTADGDYAGGLRTLYYCIRCSKPERAVETGVLDGFGSAFLLKALRDNGRGHLHSIDLPARGEVTDSSDQMLFGSLPAGHDPGWLVPDALRERWSLDLGSSRELLGPLLEEIAPIGFFIHDSLHTAEHMTWEYETVWPSLAPSGVLASDDIFWNRAFWKFARSVGRPYVILDGKGYLRKQDVALRDTSSSAS